MRIGRIRYGHVKSIILPQHTLNGLQQPLNAVGVTKKTPIDTPGHQ